MVIVNFISLFRLVPNWIGLMFSLVRGGSRHSTTLLRRGQYWLHIQIHTHGRRLTGGLADWRTPPNLSGGTANASVSSIFREVLSGAHAEIFPGGANTLPKFSYFLPSSLYIYIYICIYIHIYYISIDSVNFQQ